MKRIPVFLLLGMIPALVTTCGTVPKLPPADREWLLLPDDLPDVFAGYAPKPGTHKQLYFYKKAQTALSGFSAVYSQQFVNAAGNVADYTAQVSYCRTRSDAETVMRGLYVIEAKNRDFVKRADTAEYGVDDVLLLQSETLLYLALRKELIVYFVQIDNARAGIETVREAVVRKLRFLKSHPEAFRTKESAG